MNATATQTTQNTATGRYASGIGLNSEPRPLEEFPNWRYLLANQLAQAATEDQPPTHDDPWVQDTAELLHFALHKTPNFEGSLRQWHIFQAVLLQQKSVLIDKVLQCRLADHQSLDEISSKCNIHQGTLEAYAAVCCDIGNHLQFQSWGRSLLNPLQFARGPVGGIATILQNSFMFGACEGLEKAVDVVCRLHGPTMADGLPARDTPEFHNDFGIRGGLAQTLLSRTKKNIALMQRFEEARHVEAPGDPMSEAAINIGMEILGRVQIPMALQQEFDQLREFTKSNSNEEVSTVCDLADMDSASDD